MKYPNTLTVVLGFLLVSGCHSGPAQPPELPRLTPAVLNVVQDGQPLAGATVTLYPVDSSKWCPTGISNEKGKVVLYTNGKYKGAPTGTYKMVVSCTETDPSRFGPMLEEGAPGYEEWAKKVADEKRNTYTLVDLKYAKAATTPLEIEIPAKSTAIDLGKPVKEIL